MFMTETGPAVKKKRKLKAYVFDISPMQYGDGVVVAIARGSKGAKKMVANYTGRSVESLVNYTVYELDQPGVIAYAYHSS